MICHSKDFLCRQVLKCANILKYFNTLIETLEVGNYQTSAFIRLRDANYHSNFRVYLGREIKNKHKKSIKKVSYLLITTEMLRDMDRSVLRASLKITAIWCNIIPKKHCPAKLCIQEVIFFR